jgi:hypothetical protein
MMPEKLIDMIPDRIPTKDEYAASLGKWWRIVLDTGVFYHPEALRDLLGADRNVVVPAVAAAERARPLVRDGRDPRELHEALRSGGFDAEPLTPEAAMTMAQRVPDDHKRRRLSRDFLDLGVPASQVVAIPRRR